MIKTNFYTLATRPSGINWKDVAKIASVSTLLSLAPSVIKVIARHYGNSKKDEILYRRNERYNELADNYRTGKSAETDEESIKKYRKELHKLFEDTLYLEQTKRSTSKDPDINITVNQDQYGSTKTVTKTPVDRDSIMGRFIGPFIVLLRMLLVRGVHILAGSTLGADRRNFELVFDPNHTNPDDVAKDPFRMVIFKQKWPSHGFETKTMGKEEANELINNTIDFLAHNPKYLTIRL